MFNKQYLKNKQWLLIVASVVNPKKINCKTNQIHIPHETFWIKMVPVRLIRSLCKVSS